MADQDFVVENGIEELLPVLPWATGAASALRGLVLGLSSSPLCNRRAVFGLNRSQGRPGFAPTCR
jgi:hypothetical protein